MHYMIFVQNYYLILVTSSSQITLSAFFRFDFGIVIKLEEIPVLFHSPQYDVSYVRSVIMGLANRPCIDRGDS